MPLVAGAVSLMLKKSHERRRSDEQRRLFDRADVDRDGFLSFTEYADHLRHQGLNVSDSEIRTFFKTKDRDLDGLISFDEFCDRKTINERAFCALDLNADGFVSKDEMLRAARRNKRSLTESDIDKCFREFDKDGDKKLSYAEFCHMMNSRKHVTNVLALENTDNDNNGHRHDLEHEEDPQ